MSQSKTLGRLRRGVYLHYATGCLIVRTRGGFNGPRGGELMRWEVGHAEEGGQIVIDGDQGPWPTLAEASEKVR